jgi:predicted kinase
VNRPTLYLFVGYPGAGKTTIAQIIERETGAVHIWADVERHKKFSSPQHTRQESNELYDELNARTGELLAAGKSVIFDTNFNLYEDRQKLRDIAARHQSETVVVWIATPLEIAKQRAVHSQIVRNGYTFVMDAQRFHEIADKMEVPSEDEKVIKIDGSNLDETAVKQILGL